MSEERITYRIELLAFLTEDTGAAVRGLADHFAIPVEQAAELVTSAPVVIREHTDAAEARDFIGTLVSIGARVRATCEQTGVSRDYERTPRAETLALAALPPAPDARPDAGRAEAAENAALPLADAPAEHQGAADVPRSTPILEEAQPFDSAAIEMVRWRQQREEMERIAAEKERARASRRVGLTPAGTPVAAAAAAAAAPVPAPAPAPTHDLGRADGAAAARNPSGDVAITDGELAAAFRAATASGARASGGIDSTGSNEAVRYCPSCEWRMRDPFVCGHCGWDISEGARRCLHCRGPVDTLTVGPHNQNALIALGVLAGLVVVLQLIRTESFLQGLAGLFAGGAAIAAFLGYTRGPRCLQCDEPADVERLPKAEREAIVRVRNGAWLAAGALAVLAVVGMATGAPSARWLVAETARYEASAPLPEGYDITRELVTNEVAGGGAVVCSEAAARNDAAAVQAFILYVCELPEGMPDGVIRASLPTLLASGALGVDAGAPQAVDWNGRSAFQSTLTVDPWGRPSHGLARLLVENGAVILAAYSGPATSVSENPAGAAFFAGFTVDGL